LISKMVDELTTPETQANLKGFLDKLRARSWTKTFRSFPVFGSPSQFSLPRTTVEAGTRLEMNSSYFFTNYVLLCIIVFTYAILSRPLVLLLGAVMGYVWNYALNRDFISIGSYSVRGKGKVLILGSVTAVVVLLFAGATLFMAFGVCSTLVLFHAILHQVVNDEKAEGTALDDVERTQAKTDPV